MRYLTVATLVLLTLVAMAAAAALYWQNQVQGSQLRMIDILTEENKSRADEVSKLTGDLAKVRSLQQLLILRGKIQGKWLTEHESRLRKIEGRKGEEQDAVKWD